MAIDVGPFQMVTAINNQNAVVTDYATGIGTYGGIEFDIQMLTGNDPVDFGLDLRISVGGQTLFVNYLVSAISGRYRTDPDDEDTEEYIITDWTDFDPPDSGYVQRLRFTTRQLAPGTQDYYDEHVGWSIAVDSTGSIYSA